MEGFLVQVKNRTDNNGISRTVFWLGLARIDLYKATLANYVVWECARARNV